MSRYILSNEALEDLWSIWEHIAEESSVERADMVQAEFEQAMELLSENPGLGHVREDLAPWDIFVLFWAVYSYLIVYRKHKASKEATIEIVRVIHGYRDVKSILNDS